MFYCLVREFFNFNFILFSVLSILLIFIIFEYCILKFKFFICIFLVVFFKIFIFFINFFLKDLEKIIILIVIELNKKI